MTDKPTGVFVRLPLSDAHVLTLLDAYAGDKETTNQKMEAALLAIGTPVTGAELEPLAFVNADRLKWKIETANDVCLTFSGKPHLGGGTLNLIDGIVLHSDALAKLAEKDAEIARKDEEIERLKRIAYSGRGSLSHTIHSPARFADEARKGTEA